MYAEAAAALAPARRRAGARPRAPDPAALRRCGRVRDVLVISPSARDLAALEAAGIADRFRVRPVGGDADVVDGFDPDALVDEAESLPADGIFGSRDRSALLAAIVARRRGLPGPSPEAVLACQHKPTSRRIQQEVAPEAVPRFGLVDPGAPFALPFFVKPVVGRLSQGAREVREAADLPGAARDGYVQSFERMAQLAGAGPLRFDGLLAEQLVEGLEVTLEGYVHRGRVTVIGVTDSVHYPGTRSFQRFEYPTRLEPPRREELAEVTGRLVPALGLDDCFFNVEFAVPEDGPARIVEVNARIASQFAPLVRATHGRSTYDALLELACGGDPAWSGGEPAGVAVSWVIRVFADALVEAVPEPQPGVELLVRPGLRLSEQGLNDPASYRLAIFAEHAETRAEALERCERRSAELLRAFSLLR